MSGPLEGCQGLTEPLLTSLTFCTVSSMPFSPASTFCSWGLATSSSCDQNQCHIEVGELHGACRGLWQRARERAEGGVTDSTHHDAVGAESQEWR